MLLYWIIETFKGDSVVAFIELQPLCAVLILLILKTKD
jgi:hypothetical protein